jgi:hypothetical protein
MQDIRPEYEGVTWLPHFLANSCIPVTSFQFLFHQKFIHATSREILRSLACWDRGFESHRRRGCLSVVSVVCCQVEVTATNWSLIQRSPTDCDVSLCVIKNLVNEEAMARVGPQRLKNKQTNKHPAKYWRGHLIIVSSPSSFVCREQTVRWVSIVTVVGVRTVRSAQFTASVDGWSLLM